MVDLIHVKGLSALQALLDTLPVKIEKNIMRGALRAGAKPVAEAARNGIHSVHGDLAKSIRVTTRVKNGTVIASVSTKGLKIANKALWVEYGTKPHYISVQQSEKPTYTTRRGQTRTVSMTTINRNSLKIGSNFVGPTVHHPGAQQKPYMRPALDNNAQGAVVATGEYIKNRLATKEGLDTSGIMIEGDT